MNQMLQSVAVFAGLRTFLGGPLQPLITPLLSGLCCQESRVIALPHRLVPPVCMCSWGNSCALSRHGLCQFVAGDTKVSTPSRCLFATPASTVESSTHPHWPAFAIQLQCSTVRQPACKKGALLVTALLCFRCGFVGKTFRKLVDDCEGIRRRASRSRYCLCCGSV